MSVTTNIGCETCKIYLWIGQGAYIYTGEPDTMTKLNDFLQEHRSHDEDIHHLVFGPDYFKNYWSGWSEISSHEELD